MELVNVAILFTMCLASFGPRNGIAATIDVTSFGASGDGNTDDTNAFMKSWSSLCEESTSNPTLIVPSGKTFLVRPLQFKGPCRSSKLHIQVLGTIVAPSHASGWINCGGSAKAMWIYFTDVGGLTIDGSGKFDGQGAIWWKFQADVKSSGCKRPAALGFNNCNGLQLSGTTHVDSPKEHIRVHKCNNVDIGHLSIFAPENSPNTDGIDVSDSVNVNIHDSSFQTGDDCVAINGGSANINVTGVNCGPGHGISIGSLGENNVRDTVEQVRVINCNFTSSQNGVRIKTTPNGSGYAKDILFQQIQLSDVKNPIVIDQHYCDGHFCKLETAVQVSSVTYRNIQGSSLSKLAINFDCSETTHCTNITLDNVSISGSGARASCQNAQVTAISTSPSVTCQ